MSGTRTTIYLPEVLLAGARQMEINVSEVCQQALRAEIAGRMQSLEAAVEAGMQASALLEQLRVAMHADDEA